MKDKILCVDDEPAILHAQKRLLRKYFDVHVAEGGAQGIELIKEKGPFAVIVTDMNMPGMNGIEFLAESMKFDSNAIRMMLTGDPDLSTAENAVNEGNIFRFLRKPCPPESIAKAIKAAITQYHLVIAEKEILEKTLNQTIRVLVDILEMTSPQAFSRTARIKKYMNQIIEILNIEINNSWQYEVVSLLFPLGCISMPEDVMNKALSENVLNEDELKIFQNHPIIGHDQLIKIPRMEEVASIIKYQEKGFDGSGLPADGVKGEDLPLASRILKVALDYDKYQIRGLIPHKLLEKMKEQSYLYDPNIFPALKHLLDLQTEYLISEVAIKELKAGMILAEEIKTDKDVILAAKGQELTKINAKRIFSFSLHTKIKEPIKVLVGK